LAARLTRAPTRTEPDEWGAANRTYPASSGLPGPRDPWITPYTIPFCRAVAGRSYRRVVLAMFAQGGKSEALLDIMGQRLDQQPGPILYVGPNRQFLIEQFEPRIMDLLDQAPSLRGKVSRGKRMSKTRKIISGVPLRLAHAGSSTALKSDPAALAITDEADELMANVRGQGDPIGLIDRRGETYADFVHAIVSTPSSGVADVVHDPDSGLDFWDTSEIEEVSSAIWKLWAQGTQYHYAWPCPHCGEYFIPRMRLLRYDPKGTPTQARDSAFVECPRCEEAIFDEGTVKADLNARAVFVAPGQIVERDGRVVGDPPDSETCSFWVSGLASPFVNWGRRAFDIVEAEATGDDAVRQVVANAGFGELWAPASGSVPEWSALMRLRAGYHRDDVPIGVRFLTMGVDVQGNRLVYVVRGWGLRQESWLIAWGELYGPTDEDDVWLDLADLIRTPYGGRYVRRCFVDAGFRPGKKIIVPTHKVYDFARSFPRVVYATKGFDQRESPISVKRIEVNPRGGRPMYGLDLVRLDTNFLKSWVHERIRWPDGAAGGWHLPQEVDEGYCRQIVSEAAAKKANGSPVWIQRSRENHLLDCEALAYGAAYMLGVTHLRGGARPLRRDGKPAKPQQPQNDESDDDDDETERAPAMTPYRAPPQPEAPKPPAPPPAKVRHTSRIGGFAARLNR
jgi:phage terminase large subunit GpA-like protein